MSARGRHGGKFRYYSCQGRHKRGRTECATAHLPAVRLEQAVLGALRDLFARPETVRRALETARGELRDARPEYAAQLARVDADMRKAEALIEKYMGAFETGTMPEAVCGDRLNALATQVAELRHRRHELEAAIDTTPMDPYEAVDVSAAVRMVADLLDGSDGRHVSPDRNAVIRALVHEVRVDGPHAIYPGSGSLWATYGPPRPRCPTTAVRTV